MDAYIYSADIFCADCGRAIRRRIKREGFAPADPRDESSYDSDEYPKGPFADGGGEADCPQHCGSGPDCLNAITWADGSKAGAFLENPLTMQGAHYVSEKIAEDEGRPNEVTALWASFYAEELRNIE